MTTTDEEVDLGVPMDLAAEAAVLGACLASPLAHRQAMKVLSGEDFYRPAHQVIWQAICHLAKDGEVPEPVAVNNRLRETGDLRHAGGAPYLSDLYGAAPVGETVTHHARIVRDVSNRRQVIVAAQRLIERASSGRSETATLTSDAVRQLTEVRDRGSGDDTPVRWLAEVLDEEDSYDWLVPGLLERGDRVVWVAGEGAGKTTLLRQMAVCAAAGLHPFSLRPYGPGNSVLAVDAENSERMWRRKVRPMVRKAEFLTGADPSWRLALEASGRLEITNDRDLARLHRLVDATEAEVLAVGPLYKLHGKAIQTDDEAAPVLAALDTFRDRGITIMLEAHAGHAQSADGKRDMRPRGSSALLGWPEFGLGLRYAWNKVTNEETGKDEWQMSESEMDVVRWRGDRDERAWPDRLLRGGPMPFVEQQRTAHGIITPGAD